MLYKKTQEYNNQSANRENELLRSWLCGEAGIEALKEWLRGRYGEAM